MADTQESIKKVIAKIEKAKTKVKSTPQGLVIYNRKVQSAVNLAQIEKAIAFIETNMHRFGKVEVEQQEQNLKKLKGEVMDARTEANDAQIAYDNLVGKFRRLHAIAERELKTYATEKGKLNKTDKDYEKKKKALKKNITCLKWDI